MSQEKPRAMLVNVGGATAPAVHTLNEQRPEFICFFVSEESQPAIKKGILPALKYQPEHYDWIKTSAPQDLLECYRALVENLPRILEKWGVSAEQLGVEYTAGTKPMSVAAVLATIQTCSQYFYTGAKDASGRDRGGIGVVLDNREYTWFQTNPWEVLAVPTRQEIALLFNCGRFADAQERALRLSKVADPDMRPVYKALADLIEGYALWDRFEYAKANEKLSGALPTLKAYTAGRDDPLQTTIETVESHVQILRKLKENSPEAARLDVLDMLANAGRRADLAQKYDDATARLYAVLESLARNTLINKYGINPGKVAPELVPENIRREYIRRYSDPQNPDEGLKLGLQAQYLLLEALDDPLGKAYKAREKELNQVLNIRNQSRLAHGTTPVRPETYQKLREIVMEFAQVKDDELVYFPVMRL